MRIAAVAALVDGGPGKPSLDSALGLDRTGSGWALGSIAAGAAGSALAIEAGRRFEPVPEPTGRFSREPVEAQPTRMPTDQSASARLV